MSARERQQAVVYANLRAQEAHRHVHRQEARLAELRRCGEDLADAQTLLILLREAAADADRRLARARHAVMQKAS